jgi:helicase SWR1
LTGADTVIFYDSDFNPQMDRQCEDRAHRIGQIRDVHIFRFVSQHTIEEALLRKANQKRSLDDLVIQKGQFDWSALFRDDVDAGAMNRALGEVEDHEDARAAAFAMREFVDLEGVNDAEFGIGAAAAIGAHGAVTTDASTDEVLSTNQEEAPVNEEAEDLKEEGGTVIDYMLDFVQVDDEFFASWTM